MKNPLFGQIRLTHAKLFALSIVILLLSASFATAHASPANCDDDMTEDQRFQLEVCSSHVGCRLVVAITDNCIALKSFLGKLHSRAKRDNNPMTDEEVGGALGMSGIPAAGISSCLKLDRTKCAEYFSGGPSKETLQAQADGIAEGLSGKMRDAKRFIENAITPTLNKCDEATTASNPRDAEHARKWCGMAERNITQCQAGKTEYDAQAEELKRLTNHEKLAMVAATYRHIADKPYPTCPTTLPSGKTPNAALAAYLNPDDKKGKEREGEITAEKAREMLDPCTAAKYDPDHAADYARACEQKKSQEARERIDPCTAAKYDPDHAADYARACERTKQARNQNDQAAETGGGGDADDKVDTNGTDNMAIEDGDILVRQNEESGVILLEEAIEQAEEEERSRPIREEARRQEEIKVWREAELHAQQAREQQAREAELRAQQAQEQQERGQQGRQQQTRIDTATRTPQGASNSWPQGVEPGNLYIFKIKQQRGRDSSIYPKLVSGQSESEARAVLQSMIRNTYKNGQEYQFEVIALLRECTGRNWGAIVGDGASCSESSPRRAIQAAARTCSNNCGFIEIAHSGAVPQFLKARKEAGYELAGYFAGGDIWSMASTIAARTQTLHGHTPHEITDPEAAIGLFGKACTESNGKVACWASTTMLGCWIKVRCSGLLRAPQTPMVCNRYAFNPDIEEAECIDPKLTADGYLP